MINVPPNRDSFSQFEYEGWQRVADKYESAWSGLTRQFIPPLLEATRVTSGSRLRNPGNEFCTGDAQELEFADESFDSVAMNFGVLHLSRPEAAFGEAHRELQPGGYFGFTVWASARHSGGVRIFEQAIRVHVDPNVALPIGADYFGYGEPEVCCRILGQSGFDPISLDFRTVTVD